MKKKLKNRLTASLPIAIGQRLTSVAAPALASVVRHLLLVILLFTAGCTNEQHADHDTDLYTCPMHPTVISDRPSTCPVCGMDLVRKARPGEEVQITEDLSRLLKSPNEVVVASIRTIKGEYKSVPVNVPAQGVVTYDTRHIATIPTRVSGRLERIFIKYAYQQVSRGQKIAELYSPELVTAQRELLFLLENDPANTVLIDAAKRKLQLLGFSSSQLKALIAKKEASSTVALYSPYAGYIVTGQQAPSMNTPQEKSTMDNTDNGIVREGDYVTAGQTLFTVAKEDALRIDLNLPDVYGKTVREGIRVELSFGPNQRESAKVDLVQPFFTEGQNFLKVRVHTTRPDLRIGQLVNAEIHLTETEALWVPRGAVLVLGHQNIVFVKDRGVFKPKAVTTGVSSEGMIEIKGGLASSDEIAVNAHFLVDSESFVKPID